MTDPTIPRTLAPSRSEPARAALTAETVATHQHTVWRYLRYLGCDPAAADDLTQDTFVELARTQVEDRGDVALGGWLRVTARHLWLARCRRSGRELVRTVSPEQLESAWLDYARADGGASYRDALRACLAALPPREREAIERRYAQVQSRTEIAADAGVGIEGLKSLLRRAKARLRICIQRRIDDGTT